MIFQGQELLEDRWFQDKDPIDLVSGRGGNGILSMYPRLIACGATGPGVTRGLCGQNIRIYHVHEQGYRFSIWDEQARLIASLWWSI